MIWIYRLLMVFLLSPLVIDAQCKYQHVYLGPEIYYMVRAKEGGTRQKGFLYGFSFLYERIRHCGLYWGVETRYAVGRLDGHNSAGSVLKSYKRDCDVEGSLGFTYQHARWGKCFSFTPFLGGGYFTGKNDFVSPSPLEVTYKTHFSYLLYGALATIKWNDQVSVGVRFKVKTMYEGKCWVSDPAIGSIGMLFENENQYEVEFPLQFTRNDQRIWQWVVTPFYRYRHYGKRENYPYDFIDTQFMSYGTKACLEVSF